MDNLYNIGRTYERYILNSIKDKYKSIWLWEDIPKNILKEFNFITDENQNCDDIGCDILAIKPDNEYEFIQCKNYSTLGIDNLITISDLAGFYNFIAENMLKNCIVYYSGVLSKQILTRKKHIKYINLPYITVSNNLINPRDYQLEAYNTLKNTNRAILEMPCGTGKTLVSYLLSNIYDNIILLSPLISTTDQLIIHYKNYYGEQLKNITVNIIHSQSTRNINHIQFGNKNIIGSTFDSVDVINKIIKTLKGSIYIIIDECHNISENMLIDTNNQMNQLLTSNLNILFISATPKNYNNLESIFGNTKYTLTWNTAIQNNYICKSEFYYPNASKIIQYVDDIKFDKTIIDKTKLIYKAFFLIETIHNLNIKKCIVYLKSVEESEHFKNILRVVNIYQNLNIDIYSINYSTSKNERNKALTKFRNNTIKISIILNVHVLDEGIDIPECDSVFLTNPNNNITNIIQRISRANRTIHGTQKIAKILVWGKDEHKLQNIFDNIQQHINVSYGSVDNQFINNHIKPIKKINNSITFDNIIENCNNNSDKTIINNSNNSDTKCPICAYTCNLPSELKKHFKRNSQCKLSNEDINKYFNDVNKEKYKNEDPALGCPHCFKAFSRKDAFIRHIKTSTCGITHLNINNNNNNTTDTNQQINNSITFDNIIEK